MQKTLWAGGIAAAVLLPGCTGRLPAGYVRGDADYGYRLRAVSADGSAVTLRTEANPENGDLTFWEKAVHKRLAEVRGYQPAGRQEFRNASSPAVELLYDCSRAGVDYRYLVAVIVRGRSVHVFEAAGPREQLDADLPAIRTSISKWPL